VLVKVEWNALEVWKEEIVSIDEQGQERVIILPGEITHLESVTIHVDIHLLGTIGTTEIGLRQRIQEKEVGIQEKHEEILEIWIHHEREKMQETLGGLLEILEWIVFLVDLEYRDEAPNRY
jgi:hypothetical protein